MTKYELAAKIVDALHKEGQDLNEMAFNMSGNVMQGVVHYSFVGASTFNPDTTKEGTFKAVYDALCVIDKEVDINGGDYCIVVNKKKSLVALAYVGTGYSLLPFCSKYTSSEKLLPKAWSLIHNHYPSDYFDCDDVQYSCMLSARIDDNGGKATAEQLLALFDVDLIIMARTIVEMGLKLEAMDEPDKEEQL